MESALQGYKGSKAAEQRGELVAALGRRLGAGFGKKARQACEESDHALDALISALVARAVALGQTLPPGRGQSRAAKIEGWIHVPSVSVRALRSEN